MGYRIMGRGHAAALCGARPAGAARRAGDGRVRRPDPARRRAVRGRRARGAAASKGKGIADAVTEKIKATIDGVGGQEGLSVAVPPVGRRGRRAAYHGAVASRPARSARAPDRRLRLRRRRADRPARAARAAAARGLRVPGRRGPAALRRPRTQAELERFALRDRRGAAGARREAARGRLQLGDGGGAAGAARADDADDARHRRARRRPARGGPGRGGDAQRARRAAGHAGDGGQRRVRVGDRRRPTRSWTLTAVACPDLDGRSSRAASRSTSASSTPCAATCAPLRAAGVDTVILGCTHYPLVAADAPAHARPRRARSSPPARPSPARSSTCSAPAASPARTSARATTAS